MLACENIRFSSLFAAGTFRETSPAAKSEEKRMFSQATIMQTYRIFLFCLRFCQTFHIASYYFEVKTPLIVCTNFPKWFRFNLRFPHHKIRSTQNNTNLGFTWSYQISIMVTQYFGSTGFFFFKKTLTSVKTWNEKLFKNSAFQEKKD